MYTNQIQNKQFLTTAAYQQPVTSTPPAPTGTCAQSNSAEAWIPSFNRAYEDFWNFNDICQGIFGHGVDTLGTIERDQWHNDSL